MQSGIPEQLLLIAGSGAYPQALFDGARKAGVRRISVLAIRGMTDRRLTRQADQCVWVGVGEIERMLA